MLLFFLPIGLLNVTANSIPNYNKKINKIKFVSARFGIIFAIYISKHIRYETAIEIN